MGETFTLMVNPKYFAVKKGTESTCVYFNVGHGISYEISDICSHIPSESFLILICFLCNLCKERSQVGETVPIRLYTRHVMFKAVELE